MNCYYHPDRESVVTCVHCGVQMCRECDANAFYRIGAGTGRALCNRCSLELAKEKVNGNKAWSRKMLIKIVISAAFVFIGISFFLDRSYYGSSTPPAVWGLLMWIIAGVIQLYGAAKDNIQYQINDAVQKAKDPISYYLIKLIVYALLAPICLIINIIVFLVKIVKFKKDEKQLENIKAAINNQNQTLISAN